jgi:hypothetical protein
MDATVYSQHLLQRLTHPGQGGGRVVCQPLVLVVLYFEGVTGICSNDLLLVSRRPAPA